MPDLPRFFGARCLLIAGVVLGLASTSAAALPGPPGQGAVRARALPVKPAPSAHLAKVPVAKVPVAKVPVAKVPAKTSAKVSEKPEASPVKPVSAGSGAAWTSGEGERACFRGRRKLWQDGEGWVVKKVSVCP